MTEPAPKRITTAPTNTPVKTAPTKTTPAKTTGKPVPSPKPKRIK